MRLLISVRNIDEAIMAAQGGANFIDLKEPNAGALGGLSPCVIAEVVSALRSQGIALPLSATIGDLTNQHIDQILARVKAVGACGVTYVKVGIERTPEAAALLPALAHSGVPIVPVFIADHGLDDVSVALACALKFPGIMVDTADKRQGSLFDILPMTTLHHFVTRVREAHALVGLAGALQWTHHAVLAELAPDFAGFRTAVCDGHREAALSPERLRTLSQRIHANVAASQKRNTLADSASPHSA